jgi:hypothetical protein
MAFPLTFIAPQRMAAPSRRPSSPLPRLLPVAGLAAGSQLPLFRMHLLNPPRRMSPCQGPPIESASGTLEAEPLRSAGMVTPQCEGKTLSACLQLAPPATQQSNAGLAAGPFIRPQVWKGT